MKDKTVILALLVICGTSIGPAFNVTVAELADKTDASTTTLFQPELLVSAWGNALATLASSIVLYFTRNQPTK